jgi:hypothetical protein
MNIRTLAWVLAAGCTVAAGGVSATACSSSSSPLPSSPEHDSGASETSSGGSSSGSGSGSSSGSSSDAGADCGTTPGSHASEAGTIFCGFDDAGDLYCPTTQQCCLGGGIGGGNFAPEECAAYGAACTNGGGDSGSNTQPIAIACEQIADCKANGMAGATACCLQGAKCAAGYTCEGTPGACPYPKFSDGTAIVCEGDGGGATTACQAGETQICGATADCPTGQTCVFGKWKILQLGFCQ